MDEKERTRLECLHMACHGAGEETSFEYVIEAAQAFMDFVYDKKSDAKVVKPKFKVVEDDEEGDGVA